MLARLSVEVGWVLILMFVGREGAHGIEEYMNIKFVAFGGL